MQLSLWSLFINFWLVLILDLSVEELTLLAIYFCITNDLKLRNVKKPKQLLFHTVFENEKSGSRSAQ